MSDNLKFHIFAKLSFYSGSYRQHHVEAYIQLNIFHSALNPMWLFIISRFQLEDRVSKFLVWFSEKTSVVNFRLTYVLPVQSQKALSAPW